MSPGPARKPAALHVVEGTRNRQAEKIKNAEPKFATDYPAMPKHLKGPARSEWERLRKIIEPIGMVTKADRAMLVALVEAWAIYRECDASIAVEGLVYETKDDAGDVLMRRPNPEVAMRDQALKNIKSFSTEFGLTPSARTRVAIPEKPKGGRWKK